MPTAMIEHARFTDRASVGRSLAERLHGRRYESPAVLALPRGGVPVAVEIARRLRAPIDLLLVREIGVPGHEELALGAVVDGSHPALVVNEGVRRTLGIDEAELERIKLDELREIERRRALYLHGRVPLALEDRTVIVVDDGIATGATVRAALEAVRRQAPRRLVVAAGVAPLDVAERLRSETVEVVCLAEPDPMHAVGGYYENFPQVSDGEVVALLATLA